MCFKEGKTIPTKQSVGSEYTTVNIFFHFKAMPLFLGSHTNHITLVPADIHELHTKGQKFLHTQERMPFSNKGKKIIKIFSKFGLQ